MTPGMTVAQAIENMIIANNRRLSGERDPMETAKANLARAVDEMIGQARDTNRK